MDLQPLVLPIRVASGSFVLQSTTSQVSADRLFVRSLTFAPSEGSTVGLLLWLPGVGIPLSLRAKVGASVSSEEPTGASGFWLFHDALRGRAGDPLLSLLHERAASGTASAAPVATPIAGNRRVFARIPTALEVRWTSPRGALVAYSANVSRAGIFLETSEPPDLQETVELILSLPDGQEPARTEAVVVQRTEPGSRLNGAGLQFIGADDEFRQRIDAWLDRLIGDEEAD